MKNRFIISGGGTGGHIFPALAIANQLKKEIPEAEILFIGAQNKMEMTKVPEAGYPIEGLDIYGISRDLSAKGIIRNLRLPFILLKAMAKAKKIIRNFDPDVVIGVGGFASGPALKSAISLGIPTVIQEQNSYPGVTNKALAKDVQKIFVAYDGLERYFPSEKIVKSGNPVRSEILHLQKKSEEAYAHFHLSKEHKTLLVVGGSLGARSINQCMAQNIDTLKSLGIQIIWQTGDLFYRTITPELLAKQDEKTLIVPFIKKMDFAYSIADFIVSRAGALAIAELTLVGAPTLLIPFPFAAEDHQTKNAAALSDHNAAILIPDQQVNELLMPQLLELIQNETKAAQMAEEIKKFGLPDAIHVIAKGIIEIAKKKG